MLNKHRENHIANEREITSNIYFTDLWEKFSTVVFGMRWILSNSCT